MTSLATVIGLIPTAMGMERGSEANQPLALRRGRGSDVVDDPFAFSRSGDGPLFCKEEFDGGRATRSGRTARRRPRIDANHALGRGRMSEGRARTSFVSFRRMLHPPRTSPASAPTKEARATVNHSHAMALCALTIANDRTVRTGTAWEGIWLDRLRAVSREPAEFARPKTIFDPSVANLVSGSERLIEGRETKALRAGRERSGVSWGARSVRQQTCVGATRERVPPGRPSVPFRASPGEPSASALTGTPMRRRLGLDQPIH